jgi:hypothetical protein
MVILRLSLLIGLLAALALGLPASLSGFAPNDKGKAILPVTPRVDLREDNILLSKALAEVRRQTGISVTRDRGEPDVPLSLNLSKASFQEAVDTIAAAAKAKAVISSRDGTVSLVRLTADDRVPPTNYDGDFRVRVPRISASRDFDSNRSSCTIALEVTWTPTLRPLFLESQVQEPRVLDEKGKLVPVVVEASSLTAVDGRFSASLELALPGFPRSAAAIGEVSGKLSAVAPSKMVAFRFEADLKALSDAVPGGALRRLVREDVVCRLTRIKLDRGRWSISVALEYPERGVQLDSFQAAALVLNNELLLASKDGKHTLTTSSYVVESVGSRRTLVTYHFTDRRGASLGRPQTWHVVYRAPARIVSVPFGFTFRKLPLP